MLCQSLVGIKLTVNEKCPKNALTDGLKSIVTGHVTGHIHNTHGVIEDVELKSGISFSIRNDYKDQMHFEKEL